jgi:hypothetical protein
VAALVVKTNNRVYPAATIRAPYLIDFKRFSRIGIIDCNCRTVGQWQPTHRAMARVALSRFPLRRKDSSGSSHRVCCPPMGLKLERREAPKEAVVIDDMDKTPKGNQAFPATSQNPSDD